MGEVLGLKPAFSQRSQIKEKEVLLFEWWLTKAEKSCNGSSLSVGGFTRRGEAVTIFRSAPIIKRLNHCTLETSDGITLTIQGSINKTRTIDNGFSLEASKAFLFGFSTTWDNFTKDSSGNNSSEGTFELSLQDKTVLLRDWWLRKVETGSDGNKLAVGGLTKCGKATRLFDSSSIIKRNDAYTLETVDGITIRIEGFINKIRTLDNGFPLEACKTFLIGFPTTWTDFANGSSWDKSSHADISVSASWSAEWSKDSLDNEPFGFPVKSENKILDNVPCTSTTSVFDSGRRLGEAIRKFSALFSMCKPAPINNQLQGDESCGANLRDSNTGYNACQAGRTPVCIHSEIHEANNTEEVHTEGAGCLTGDLHVDGLPQDKYVSHVNLEFIEDAVLSISKKSNWRAVTKVHHDEAVGTSSSKNSVVGKDYQKEKIAWKNSEKFEECSTRRLEKIIPGLSKMKNLIGEDQKYAKYEVKPVRRSLRLKLLNPENVHEGFPDNSQFLKDDKSTFSFDCIAGQVDGTPANSKALTSQTAKKRMLKCTGKKKYNHTAESTGQVDGTPANSKALTSQTAEKRMSNCTGKKKYNHTAESTLKVEQNDYRNQLSGTSFEEKISFSCASFSRSKTSYLIPV